MRPGPVGVVAAAGTGAQEVACLIDAAGSGVSHIIGVGGRDLSTAVGGTMVRQGLAMLARDEQTETLLLVAKEPEALEALADAVPGGMRAVAALVGWEGDLDGWEVHPTLEAAALAAAGAAGAPDDDGGAVQARPGRVLGLFSGGSLAHEACVVLDPLLGAVATEPEAIEGDGHVVVDLGTERYTQGRPHPMVDLGIRLRAARGGGRRRAHGMRPARRRLRPRRARRPRLRAGGRGGAGRRGTPRSSCASAGPTPTRRTPSRQAAALRDAGRGRRAVQRRGRAARREGDRVRIAMLTYSVRAARRRRARALGGRARWPAAGTRSSCSRSARRAPASSARPPSRRTSWPTSRPTHRSTSASAR